MARGCRRMSPSGVDLPPAPTAMVAATLRPHAARARWSPCWPRWPPTPSRSSVSARAGGRRVARLSASNPRACQYPNHRPPRLPRLRPPIPLLPPPRHRRRNQAQPQTPHRQRLGRLRSRPRQSPRRRHRRLPRSPSRRCPSPLPSRRHPGARRWRSARRWSSASAGEPLPSAPSSAPSAAPRPQPVPTYRTKPSLPRHGGTVSGGSTAKG